MFYWLAIILRPLLLLIWRPRVYGNRRALWTRGKVMFICNHVDMLDPLMLGLVSPRIIHFMAKKELFEKPIGNFVFRNLFVFPVDRGSADIKSIKSALKLLEKGKAFGIFPEGRRMVADRMDEFEMGTSLISIRSGAPIVPVYLKNDSFRKGVKMIVGSPIRPEEVTLPNLSRKENEQLFTRRIRNALEQLQCELERICGS